MFSLWVREGGDPVVFSCGYQNDENTRRAFGALQTELYRNISMTVDCIYNGLQYSATPYVLALGNDMRAVPYRARENRATRPKHAAMHTAEKNVRSRNSFTVCAAFACTMKATGY